MALDNLPGVYPAGPYSAPPGPTASGLTTAQQFRADCRAGKVQGITRNQCPGYVQTFFVALPRAHALDFMVFCQRNQKPCPVLEVVDGGGFEPRRMAPGADLRTDLAKYSVYRHGERVEDVEDVRALWREDFVSFLIGSNTSCDLALRRAGVQTFKYRWVVRTAIECDPAGPFGGPMICTMRWLTPQELVIATQLTSRFPFNHGVPIHVGDPAAIGADLAHPLTGEPPPPVPAGMIPTFWGCSVTPHMAAINARLELMVTSAPACGFITDVETDKFGSP